MRQLVILALVLAEAPHAACRAAGFSFSSTSNVCASQALSLPEVSQWQISSEPRWPDLSASIRMRQAAHEAGLRQKRTVTLITWDARRQAEFWVDKTGRDMAVRFEHLVYVDLASWKTHSSLWTDQFKDHWIVVPDLGTSALANENTMWRYTLSTLGEVMSVSVAGRRVIDGGAGDWLLLLGAARLGARSLVGIENNPKRLRQAGSVRRANESWLKGIERLMVPREEADLTRPTAFIRRIQSLMPLETYWVSNLGSWPGYTGNSLHSLRAALQLRTDELAAVILGGFVIPCYDPETSVLKLTSAIDDIPQIHSLIKKLRRHGFAATMNPSVWLDRKFQNETAFTSLRSNRWRTAISLEHSA